MAGTGVTSADAADADPGHGRDADATGVAARDTLENILGNATNGLALHAPTPEALTRARRNLVNFRREHPETPAVLVVNGAAATHALDAPDPATDAALVLCGNSLAAAGRTAPPGARTTPAAVALLHTLQQRGWSYFRA